MTDISLDPTLSAEAITAYVLMMTSDQLEQQAENFTLEQLRIATQALRKESDTLWQEKLFALYNGLHRHKLLEAVGTSLNSLQFTELLLHIGCQEHHPKLSPLLVGLKTEVFEKIIAESADKYLDQLKQQCIAEPIQHQLTAFAEKMRQEESAFTDRLSTLKKWIHEIEIEGITSEEISKVFSSLNSSSKIIDVAINKLDRALSLAWNTNRTDIIDDLTELKEFYHNDARVGLGHPTSSEQKSSGLYNLFEKRLNDIFGHDDSRPVIEALGMLKIWYLKDYASLGLLPNLSEEQKEQLTALENPSKESNGTPSDNSLREDLRQEALNFLKARGLNTIADFKRKKIYSRTILEEFLISPR